MYKPRPIDTGGLQLPDEFLPLIEKLAEHTHDIWAAGRISEGWVLGEVRSAPATA